MRTIKFRGRSRKTGEWLVGDLLQVANEVFIAPSDGDWFDFIPWTKNNVFHLPSATYEVIHDTVGQCTGLLDKNGKESDEGDIVANDFGNAYIVNMAVEWCTDGYWALHEIDGDDTMHFVADYLKEIEAIGNIYDNPELLKQ